jgi:hypothetical protein
MTPTRVIAWIVWAGLLCGATANRAQAQHDGFLGTADVAPPVSETMLPPGAVRQGAYIDHPVQSPHENLHLLASFYYGNSREWRRIYTDNRAVITNPNRLPVGEVLRIQVGENWQPKVAYATWFALAVRNGEWQPGVPWQRATEAPIPPASDASRQLPRHRLCRRRCRAEQPTATPTFQNRRRRFRLKRRLLNIRWKKSRWKKNRPRPGA